MSGIVGSRFNIRGSGLVGSLGTDGQVFTSSGAGKSAVFEAAAGGKVLQVQYFNIAADQSTASTSYVATTLTDQITPSATSSKILVLVAGGRTSFGGGTAAVSTSLYRQIDSGGYSSITVGSLEIRNESGAYGNFGLALNYLDSPSTTSAVDYKLYMKTNANTSYWNSADSMVSITLMEIGA